MADESSTKREVRGYWERASCGTDRTTHPKHSREYFEEIEAFRYSHEPFIHSFAQFSRWRGKEVLEVGVGAGTDFLQFARAGARVHGVDLTDEGIQNASARLSLYELEASSLQQCNAENLPFPDDNFDLVYSWGVIHHADDMQSVLREIYRVARPGGRVKIMVYNLRSLHALYLYLRYVLLRGKLTKGVRWAVYHHQESYATKVYSWREVREMLRSLPHEDLQVSFWDQKIRDGARFEGARRLLQRLMPERTRWYMAFEFTKAPQGETGTV